MSTVSQIKDSIKVRKNRVNLNLTLIGFKEREHSVLYSPALDMYAYGDNNDSAFQSFHETISLYIDHQFEENTLEKDLKRLGWQKSKHFKTKFSPPSYNPSDIMSKRGITNFKLLEKRLELQA